jgi:hypothetical protein
MPCYCVKFVNRLLSSNGHPFTAVQRTVRVLADDPDHAARLAQRRFEELEHVPDWRNHAQIVQVEIEENGVTAPDAES